MLRVKLKIREKELGTVKDTIRKYHVHIMLIILGTLFYFLGHFQRAAIPAPIFDILQSELNVSATKITTFSAIFMYCYALGTLLCGVLVDKFGGIKVIVAGSILFTLGCFLFSATEYLPLMYLSRGLVGIGSATFYLSLLSEVKKCFKDKHVGVVISIILFLGYLGGVCANAPFVIASEKFGWEEVLKIFTFISIFTTIAFLFVQHFLKSIHINEKVHLNHESYVEVLTHKNNYYLGIFTSLCTGLYYVMMTVLGVKFLKDFLGYSSEISATILSFLVIIGALSGIIFASLSKIFNNRMFFVKLLAFIDFFIFGIISVCIMFNIKTPLVAVLVLLIAVNAANTPLTAPIIMSTNNYSVRTTAVSVINSISFVFVGLVATIIGFLLDLFPIVGKINGNIIYGKESYLTVFLFFTVLAVIEIFVSFKIKEKV